MTKQLEVVVIKMLTKIKRRMDKHREKFNREIKNVRKNQ